jgi:hypothetical protein
MHLINIKHTHMESNPNGTLSENDMTELRARRKADQKLAESMMSDPGGGDNVCLACE